MVASCTVVIGATPHHAALLKTAGGGEVLAFSADDPLAALEAISTRQPQVVALERVFAATPRGAALIDRIRSDPSLASAEIRVVSPDGGYAPVPAAHAQAGNGAPAVAAPSNASLDYRGTRRAPRFRMTDDTEVLIDGNPARLVDLSTCGAQVVLQVALKPQQRVRVTLIDLTGVIRVNGSVAWASFEIPKGMTQYRAGIAFTDAREDTLDAFRARHQA